MKSIKNITNEPPDSADDMLCVCSWCGELYDPDQYEADEDYCSAKCRNESEACLSSHEGSK